MFFVSQLFAVFQPGCHSDCDPGFQKRGDGSCYLWSDNAKSEGSFPEARSGCKAEPSFHELTLPGFVPGTTAAPAGGGVAVADFNSDKIPDIVALGHDATYLYAGQLDVASGTYTVVKGTLPSGLDYYGGYESALPYDADSDGDLDLALGQAMTEFGHDELLINDGEGKFVVMGAALGVTNSDFTCSAATFAATDWDRDGSLDLVTTSYNYGVEYQSNPLCVGWNRILLWENNRYVADALAAFPEAVRSGPTLSLTPHDFDLDGNVDIMVNVDKDGASLWSHTSEELSGTFQGGGVGGMGVGLSDFNRDGAVDIVAPWFGRFGFYLSRMEGSTIQYYDSAEALGVTLGDRVSWAGGFADVNNDGREDLYIANGSHNPGGDVGKPDFMANAVLIQSESGSLTDRALDWGLESLTDGAGNTHSWVAIDLNRDGVLDYVQTNVTGQPIVHLSQGCTSGHFLVIDLQGSAAQVVGARVQVTTADGTVRTQWASAGGAAYGSGVDPSMLHIGLGAITDLVSVTVTWPDGSTSVQSGIAPDDTLNVEWVPN